MKTVLFINAHSRKANRFTDQLISEFVRNKAGFELVDIIVVRELESFKSYLKKLKSIKGLECVIVGSGDGTILSVLNALKGQKLIYGFLPLGTSNVFARSLGLPASPKAALEIIRQKRSQTIALGSVNGILFPNIAGIGVPVSVADNLSNKSKKYFGPLSYVMSGLRELRRHSAFECEITIDGKKEVFQTHYLLVANGKYHGPLPVSKNSSLFNNELILVTVGSGPSHWQSVKSMIRFGLQTHEADPKTRMIAFSKARLTTKPTRKIEADGEIISRTPATIEVIKDAISVFTPKT